MSKAEQLGVEILFLNGDLVYGGLESLKNIEEEWAVFDGQLEVYSGEIYRIPGNHDLSTPQMEEYYKEKYLLDSYSFLRKGIQFVIFNSIPTASLREGILSQEEIFFIKKELEKYDKSVPIVFITHHALWSASLSGLHKKAFSFVDNAIFFTKSNWWQEIHSLFGDRKGFVVSGDGGVNDLPYSFFKKDNIVYINNGISAQSLKENTFLYFRFDGENIVPIPILADRSISLGALAPPYNAQVLGIAFLSKIGNLVFKRNTYAVFSNFEVLKPLRFIKYKFKEFSVLLDKYKYAIILFTIISIFII